MQHYENEIDYYREDYGKKMMAFYDAEKEYVEYFRQFLYEYTNGIIEHEPIKQLNHEEWEKMSKMRYNLETKRLEFKQAEDKLHYFYKK